MCWPMPPGWGYNHPISARNSQRPPGGLVGDMVTIIRYPPAIHNCLT